MISERLLWLVTCPNHVNFRLLTVARKAVPVGPQERGSCKDNFEDNLGLINESVKTKTKGLHPASVSFSTYLRLHQESTSQTQTL